MGLFDGASNLFSMGSELLSGWMNDQYAEDRQNSSQNFAGNQQALAAQFNSAEAAANRDFQRHQSDTAHQREVLDLNAAGLNPMLALMKNGNSTPGGSQASVGPAGAGIALAKGVDLNAAMNSASNIRLQQAATDKTEAEASRTRAEEEEIKARTPTHAVSIEVMKQNIEKTQEEIRKIIQETDTSAHSAANLAQQTLNLKEVIPQIQATVDQLRAHTKLAGAQTTLTGAQTTLAGATTAQTKAHTTQLGQQIAANLPALEAALKDLEKQAAQDKRPAQMQDAAVHDSFTGSLGAVLRALNPLNNFLR